MRFCSPLLLLLGAATFSPLRALDVYAQSAVIHESRNMAPRGYYSSGPAPSDVIMDLQIALLPSDIEGLRVAMTNISTPGSHSYGQHLSKQQVASCQSSVFGLLLKSLLGRHTPRTQGTIGHCSTRIFVCVQHHRDVQFSW